MNPNEMHNIRGYGFRPSDEELVRSLEDVAFDHGSPVQYITQLEDICKFEPWELPGLSVLQQPGCTVWYFIYSLKHKYNNGELINRATKEGYWKSTGKPRTVKASDTRAEIGRRRTLAFYEGRPKSKGRKKSKTKSDYMKSKTRQESHNRRKAVWLMHEFQLNTATSPSQVTKCDEIKMSEFFTSWKFVQKTFFLGKLMKQSEEVASISKNKNENAPMDLSDWDLGNLDELLAMMKTPDH